MTRIEKSDSVLVVVDIQERLYPHILDHDQLEKNCTTLISGLRILEVPFVVTQQYSKGLGPTIDPIKTALGSFDHIEKTSFSCCGNDDFMKQLKIHNKKNVILCGMESHVCVLQTALDLQGSGFQVIVVADCVGSRKAGDKHYALQRMLQAGCIISTYESILFELCKESGTEIFKEISRLVK